jgi:hypothetical protein
MNNNTTIIPINTLDNESLSDKFSRFSFEKTEKHNQYLDSKNIKPPQTSGIRYGNYRGTPSIVVPYQDVDNQIVALQHILPNGDKIFEEGSLSSGAFFPLSDIKSASEMYLAEGYATAQSLYDLISGALKPISVVSCGAISNIPMVAEVLKQRYPEINITIAPDYPKSFVKSDPVVSAVNRCKEIGFSKVIYPMEMENGDDWNDSLIEFSSAEILTNIEEQISNFTIEDEAVLDCYSEEKEETQEPLKPEPFPFSSLPVNTSLYAQELADKNMVSDAIVGSSILAICSLTVQENTKIKTGHGGSHPLSLYILSVAESGEGKTTIESRLKTPVDEKEREDYKTYRQEFDIASHRLKQWEEEKKKIPADEIREFFKKNPKPKLPPDPKIIMSDVTIEGMLKQFNRGKDSLGLFTSEGVKVFGGYSMRDGKEMHTIGTLSSLWDGEPIERTRGADNEGMKIFDKHLTSNILIQNQPFSKIWSNELFQAQGILARFLICQPTPKAGSRIRGLDALVFEHADDFNNRVKQLLEKDSEEELRELKLSPDAHRLNIEYYNEVELESGIGGRYQDIRPFASKTAEQARRIAGVITLFEGSSSSEIDEGAMKKGITLARWYLNEALRISNEDILDAQEENQNKILGLLKQKGNMTFRDVCRHFPNKKNRKKSFIEPLIEKLKNLGKITQNDKKEWMLKS